MPAPAADGYHVHADHLGSPQAMTDDAQQEVWRIDTRPFGEVEALTWSVENNQRFPGQYADAESGYSYNYFRDYEPTLGRYLQADPIGLAGGINTYAYVGGNPVARTDAMGLACDGTGCWTTPLERSLANGGNYSGYYALACRSGDGYACAAGHVAANDNDLGRAATNRLLGRLEDAEDEVQMCFLQSAVLESIRKNLAASYANYLPGSREAARWPRAIDIARIHWNEFAKYGVSPSGFGGTPFGSRLAGVQTALTNLRYNWCPNCE